MVENPKDAANAYNLGNSYYQQKQYESAAESFVKAAQNGDKNLQAKSLYNLGNTLYRTGDLEKSIAAYEKALQVDPQDEQTQLNLEFVKKKLQEKQKQQSGAQQSSN